MQVPSIVEQVRSLVHQLQQFNGHRTIWFDLDGRLCHAEPDEELEAEGYLYVATLMHADEDSIADAVSRFASLHPERPALQSWVRRGHAVASLAVAG